MARYFICIDGGQTGPSFSVSAHIIFFCSLLLLLLLRTSRSPVRPCHSRASPPLSASLSLSIRSLCRGCKMSLMIGSNPQRGLSYLDTFTICSPSVAESLGRGSAAEECCFLLFLNLDLSFLLLPFLLLCVYVCVWHPWWLHCVHCVVSSGNSGNEGTVPLTSAGKKKTDFQEAVNLSD